MKVGPILGILAFPRANANLFAVGQNESFPEILAVAEKMKCIAFVFSPFDIDWSKYAVWGYRYNHPSYEWERHLYPLPGVIYNRIPNRTIENREDIRDVLISLKKLYGSRFFNPCFLDKWRTHQILFNDKETREFLPDTRKLGNPGIIHDMLERYGAVYLKPKANSLGNEILRVDRTEAGQYYFVHQTLNQERREGQVADCQQLLDQLPPVEDTGVYLVQQSVPLARCSGHPFDLRLLMQKNRRGLWQRTGLAARIAGTGSITTHLFYGGTRCQAGLALREASRTHRFSLQKVEKQLKKLELAVPAAIETYYGLPFGELEMDVGVDKKGKVWFFEANSKPFRFDEKLIRAKSLVRLMHYVHFLDNTPLLVMPGHQRR